MVTVIAAAVLLLLLGLSSHLQGWAQPLSHPRLCRVFQLQTKRVQAGLEGNVRERMSCSRIMLSPPAQYVLWAWQLAVAFLTPGSAQARHSLAAITSGQTMLASRPGRLHDCWASSSMQQ